MGRRHVGRCRQRGRERTARATRGILQSGVHQIAGAGGPQIEGVERDKPRIGAEQRASPFAGHAARTLHDPVVAASHHSPRQPRSLHISHHVDRRPADPHKYVVVHLHGIDAVEDSKHRRPARADYDGVVDESVSTIRIAGAVAANANHVGGIALQQHVADDVGVLHGQRRILSVRSDQLELVIQGSFDPVVSNLIALSPGLDVVATVAVVDVAVFHPKHRAGMGGLVRGHVDLVSLGSASTGVHLGVFEQQRTGIRVGAEHAVLGAVVNDSIAYGDVVGVVVEAPSSTSRQLQPLEHVMITRRFDGVRSARKHWPLSIHRYATNCDLRRR